MANWRLNQGYHLDQGSTAEIVEEASFSIDVAYTARPFAEIELVSECELSLSVIQAVALDLLQLVPEKFRSSVILQEYLEEAGTQIGSWLTSVKNIVKLLSPNTVGTILYLRHLGALIGVEFSPEDETTEGKLRKELLYAIDWYKIKGTYESIQILSLIQQFTVNFYDMYTNDYIAFYMVDWFVGDEDENPPGFDSSYYKSPHFGLEVLLNQVYEETASLTSGSASYLWKAEYLDNLSLQVEKTRPIHTVPHYLLLLNPKTDEFGHIIEVDGEIKTKVHGEWERSTKYFDEVGSGNIWNFDEEIHFDQSSTAFIKSITKWVLGTGYSYGIDSPALTGTIDTTNIVITDEKIIFEFIVPKSEEQDGLSELGLYVPGTPDTLVLSSIFPELDKDNSVELRVLVEVYKKDLSPEEEVPESGVSSGS